MNNKSDPNRPSIKSFAVRHMAMPELPEVEKIISLPRKTIFVNTAARAGANITELMYCINDEYRLFERG